MANANTITVITNSLAKATLGDGAVPVKIILPNNVKPRAAVTSLTTMFEVTWYKPQRSIWLQYATRERAVAACESLHNRRIASFKIRCVLNESRRRFSAQLQGLPQDLGLQDITPYLPQGEMLDGVSYGTLSYRDIDDALLNIKERVRSRTNEHILSDKMVYVSHPMKQKAEIILSADAANLAAHANALDGIRTPQLGNGKVFFVERLRLYIAIDSGLYKRRSKTLKGIAERASDKHRIEVKIFNGELRYEQNTFLVFIVGNGRAAVQQVKAEIDEIVALDAIKGLQRQENETVGKRRIYLNTVSEYKKAVDGGGLERLKEYYGGGDDTVVFEDEHDPPRVTITSLSSRLDKAKDLLFQIKTVKGTDVGECPICAEEGVQLIKMPACNHTSCERCVNEYCVTNASIRLPLGCFVDPECGATFPIGWLHQQLSPRAHQLVVEGVIASHCQQNPDNFVRCTGSDCNEQLSAASKATKTVCAACLTVNCTACRMTYHFGETCEGSLARRDNHDKAFEQYLAEVGGKLCPRCATPGIRVNGCFHIECPSCSVHYCWLCLVPFEAMGEAYAHMDAVHGGPYGGPADEEERFRLLEEDD